MCFNFHMINRPAPAPVQEDTVNNTTAYTVTLIHSDVEEPSTLAVFTDRTQAVAWAARYVAEHVRDLRDNGGVPGYRAEPQNDHGTEWRMFDPEYNDPFYSEFVTISDLPLNPTH